MNYLEPTAITSVGLLCFSCEIHSS